MFSSRLLPAVLLIAAGLAVVERKPLEGGELRISSGERTITRQLTNPGSAVSAANIGGDVLLAAGQTEMERIMEEGWEQDEFVPGLDGLHHHDGRIPGCDAGCCQSCGWWGGAEYLLWWRPSRRMPPLVTTSLDADGDVVLDGRGILGQPDTVVLFGDRRLGGDARPGGRLTIGRWIDEYEWFGIAGRFYGLVPERFHFRADSDQFPVLARPFVDVAVGPTAEDSILVAAPGQIEPGRVNVRGGGHLLGADVLGRLLVHGSSHGRIDLIGGYKASRIDEDLSIRTSSTIIGQADIRVDDVFDTRNEFHGGQIGMMAEHRFGCWRMDLLASVGLGNMAQQVTIQGNTETRVANQPLQIEDQGLLARRTNIGRHTRNQFAVVPELGLNLGYQFNQYLDFTLGYSFIHWNRVVRPEDHLDRGVNLTLDTPVPVGPGRPDFTFRNTEYWAHGLSFGMQFQY